MQATPRTRTKVTVLGGYLGAGKTTLLNAILRTTPEPLGVIVNDFGSINVDAELIGGQANVDGEVALQNGCICCTIRSDLLDALRGLVERPNAPRHIIIETSGVSDPAAVARTFLQPEISGKVALSTIAVCVDPMEYIRLGEEQRRLADDQVRSADFVVLTKCDAASAAERSMAAENLQFLLADLRIIESFADRMPTDLILDTPRSWVRSHELSVVRESAHVHEVGEHHGHTHDGHAFATWTFHSQEPLSIYHLRRVLRELPPSVLRAKGFAFVEQDPETRLTVQIAGRRAELSPAGEWNGQRPATALVFLGSEGQLDPDELRPLLEECVYTGEDANDGFMDEMMGYFNRMLTDAPAHRG